MAFLMACVMASFDTAEGVLNQLGVNLFEEILEGLSVDGVFSEPVWDGSLAARDLTFGSDFGSDGSVVAAELSFGFGDFNGGV